jgi:hypothetical protein
MDKHFVLALFHILIIVPLFLYVGVYRASTHPWVYKALLVMGGILLLFHGSKFVSRLAMRSDYAYINAIHALLFAPLLIYIGWHQQDTPRAAYEVLLMITFAALGYHMFSLVKILQIQE